MDRLARRPGGFRVARSLDVLAEEGEAFDLIFLDVDHRLKTVMAEIPAALRRLRPGGFVLLHASFRPSPSGPTAR
jgi:predicted O-methyltransferase YrrM